METIHVETADELKKLSYTLDAKQEVSFNCKSCNTLVHRKIYRERLNNYQMLCRSCMSKQFYSNLSEEQKAELREKTKKTCIKKYGVENPAQAPEFKEKRSQTCQDRFGTTSFAKTDMFKKRVKEAWSEKTEDEIQEIVNKNKKTCLDRYGVENVMTLGTFKEKTKQTNRKRYGKDYQQQTEEGKKVRKETLMRKFGVDNPSKVTEFVEKRENTCLEKYGVKHPLQSEDIRNKAKQTNVGKYGVESFSQTNTFTEKVKETWSTKSEDEIKDIVQRKQQTCIEKYGVPNYSQTPEFAQKRYHTYLYDDIYFDSKPELAFWIWAKETGKDIIKCTDYFEYTYNDKVYKYFPDFKIGEEYFELKGDQFLTEDGRWCNPFDHSLDEKYETKHQCAIKNNVRILYSKDYQVALDYVDEKYTKNFLELFNLKLEFPYLNVDLKETTDLALIQHFHKSIYEASRKGRPSPIKAWQDKNIIKRVALNRLKYMHSCKPSDILQGFNVTKIAPKISVFKPSIARDLCNKYLSEYDQVFDPFSGFSGRLLGVTNCKKQYIGQDIHPKHVEESNEIIQYKKLQDLAVVIVQDILTDEPKEFECLFTCPPYGGKEHWNENNDEIEKSCDEWIDICLEKYKCKRYLFVVDVVEKYKDYIVETLTNQSHFGTNHEYVVLINA